MKLLKIVEQAEEIKRIVLEKRTQGDDRPYKEILEEILQEINNK